MTARYYFAMVRGKLRQLRLELPVEHVEIFDPPSGTRVLRRRQITISTFAYVDDESDHSEPPARLADALRANVEGLPSLELHPVELLNAIRVIEDEDLPRLAEAIAVLRRYVDAADRRGSDGT